MRKTERKSTHFSGFGYPDETLFLVFDLLHQTQGTVFHQDIQTPRSVLKNEAVGGVF